MTISLHGGVSMDQPAGSKAATQPNDATITHIDGAPAPSAKSAQTPERSFTVEGYRILQEISRGGQAIVFAATYLKTGRKVALKVMHEGPFATDASRARFSREAEILASLHHPNIVAIIDRGRTADGADYLAMEYIDGIPLDEAMWQTPGRSVSGRDQPAAALQLFLKICDAVNAAHLRGIIHRDLKPSNIRVDERNEPHVLDFGLARGTFETSTGSADPVTLTGQFMGSLPWASPEQAEGIGEKIDSRSDVYSLGVILYQLVTGGQFPYQVAGSIRDVLNNILTADPPAPSIIMAAREARDLRRHARRSMPAKLVNPVMDAIILRALAKRRDDRYQSAGELARDIENYLSGRPTLAGGNARPSHHHRWWWIGGAAAAIVILGTVAMFRSPPSASAPLSGALSNPALPASPAPQTPVAPPAADATLPAPAVATPAVITPESRVHPLVAASSLREEYEEVERIMGRFVPIADYIRRQGPERIAIWRAAANAGDPVGRLLVSRCHEFGVTVPVNGPEALRQLRDAADQGLPLALCMVGNRLRASQPPVQDFPEALVWYLRAAEAGSGRAMVDLGIMHRHGQGTPVDHAAAMRWFEKAAAIETPAAFHFIAEMIVAGQAVPTSGGTDVVWHRRAAAAGVPHAMERLGHAYLAGRGMARDFSQAKYWFEKAFETLPPLGAYGLGELYATGQGVEQNLPHAAAWYQRSANGNVPIAARKLAILYEEGRGVPQDALQARAWYTKAAAGGDAESKKWLDAHPAP